MQDLYTMREINDEELDFVYGGGSYSSHPAHTDAGVSVHTSATGGSLHFDAVIAKTQSISITTHGESVSSAIGFALAIAL